jgi:hypothetical protein
MKIEPKPPALLEAQTSKFLMSDYPPKSFSYVKMGREVGALLDATIAARAGNSVLYTADEATLQQLNPVATPTDIIALPSRYRRFLAEQGDASHEETRRIAEYIARYESFRPAVEGNLGDLVGSGHGSHTFRIEMDHKPYAVRKVHAIGSLLEIDKHLRAAIRVEDIPHIEHIVAASYRNRETVAPYISGVDLWHIDNTTIDKISHEQFDEFYACLEQANSRGVGLDGIGDNILYDEVEGFTAVDVGLFDHIHINASDALYDNFTNQADHVAYDMTRHRVKSSQVCTIAKMCRLLAHTLAAKDPDEYEWRIARLNERADDLEERLRSPIHGVAH